MMKTTALLLALLAPQTSALALSFRGLFGKDHVPRRSRTSLQGVRQPTTLEEGRKLARKNKDIEHLFEANEAWRTSMTSTDKELFSSSIGTHAPSYLWIGCSDARMPATTVLGESPGNVFVHRNIGNQVLNTDTNVMSVIQYAVDYLKVPHIIVCGHYDCGGIRAASNNVNHYAPLENWLTSIRNIRRAYAGELEAISDPEERHRRLVELNVKEQCLSLFKTAVVQRRLVETHQNADFPFSQPRIHGLVYDTASGKINRLPVDFNTITDELAAIYDVYRKA